MSAWTSRGQMARTIARLQRQETELRGLIGRLLTLIPPHHPEDGPAPSYSEAIIAAAIAASPPAPRPATVEAAGWSTADIGDA